MGTAFHIRDIREADIEKIHRLEKKAFSDPWGIHGLKESLGQSYTKLFGAWEKEELLGYAIVYFMADEGELVRIAVTRNAVGKRRGEKCDFKEQFEELVRFTCSRPDQQDI